MGVNVENINRLIETVSKVRPRQFDMRFWADRRTDGRMVAPDTLLHDCGTVACLGGWTNAIFKTEVGSDGAARVLGLDDYQRRRLFFGFPMLGNKSITRAQAIRVLEHLRDTGEVDWSKRGRR